MTLVLRWRVPPRQVATRWRGPAGLATAIEREPLAPIAAVVGPPGTGGAGSTPVRIDAPLGATWTLPHSLGRVPLVQVFMPDGEQVLADVGADTTTIVVGFAEPQAGFVLAF